MEMLMDLQTEENTLYRRVKVQYRLFTVEIQTSSSVFGWTPVHARINRTPKIQEPNHHLPLMTNKNSLTNWTRNHPRC